MKWFALTCNKLQYINRQYPLFIGEIATICAEVQYLGGRVLVRNPAPDHREGDLRGATIVIEFEDMGAARKFYESEAYTAARAVRETAAETDLMLVEGV